MELHQVYHLGLSQCTLDFEDLLSKLMMERVENTAKECLIISINNLEQFK